MRVLGDLRRFLVLDRADRWLLVRAFVWLSVIDLLLRSRGLQRFDSRVAREATQPATSPEAFVRARRYARRITAAARRHPLRPACLQRSLVLHYWLTRDGLSSQLRIGVRREAGQLKAHAWVEVNGQPVNEHLRALADFTPLVGSRTLPGAGPWSGRRVVWGIDDR